MLIIGSDYKMAIFTKTILNSCFDIKDIGLIDVILRIKISRIFNRLIQSQSYYMDKILGKFTEDNSTVARTPRDIRLHLSNIKGEVVSQVEYSRVIGGLM